MGMIRSWMAMLIAACMFAVGGNPAGASQASVERDVTVGPLAATLSLPPGASIGVVIVAGSGPTDRNGNSPQGVKSDAYRQLAAALAASGIASIRYDKRGVAGSVAAVTASSPPVVVDDFVADVVAMTTFLQTQEGIGKVLIAGHSEGGLLALLASAKTETDGLVLLSSPGRRLGVILREQVARQYLPPELGKDVERVLSALEEGREPGPVDPPLDALFHPRVLPFLRSMIGIEPAALLAGYRGRMLIVAGGKDIQVTRSDFDALAAARTGVVTHWEEGATHTLKLAVDGDPVQMKTYTDPSIPLAPGIATAVTSFVRNTP